MPRPLVSLPFNGLLVLGAVFLLSARLSQEGMSPAAAPSAPPRHPETGSADQVVLEYSSDRRITLNRREVPRSELGVELRAIYRDRVDKTLWLLGAGTLRYGEVADVINTAKIAGVERVGVITPEMRKRRR
jgi:biopolymer transport protein ExbD